MYSKLMFTISGPSCAGKTTLLNELLNEHGDTFALLPSDTTRKRREGEWYGEYNFVSEEEFDNALNDNLYCCVRSQDGNMYGVLKGHIEIILDAGKVPIKVLDPQGVIDLRRDMDADVFSVYVDGLPRELLIRWLQRVHKDENPDFELYAARIFLAILGESEWKEDYEYIWDFLYDTEKDEPTMRYALSRIAKGKISLAKAKRLSPILQPAKQED